MQERPWRKIQMRRNRKKSGKKVGRRIWSGRKRKKEREGKERKATGKKQREVENFVNGSGGKGGRRQKKLRVCQMGRRKNREAIIRSNKR